jgi:hypothetical protein
MIAPLPKPRCLNILPSWPSSISTSMRTIAGLASSMTLSTSAAWAGSAAETNNRVAAKGG